MNFKPDNLTRKVPAMLKKSAHRLTATVRHYFRGGTGVDNPFARWRFLRPVSAVVLTAFTMLSTAPAVAAVRQDAAQQKMAAANGPSAGERLANLLQELKDAASDLAKGKTLGKAEGDRLDRLKSALEAAQVDLDRELKAVEERWEDKGLSKAQEEQAQIRSQLKQKNAELNRLTKQLANDGWKADSPAWEGVRALLKDHSAGPTHHPTDWSRPAWAVETPHARPALTDPAEILARIQQGPGQPKATGKRAPQLPKAEITAKSAAPKVSPIPKNPAPPSAADLAPTLDAPQTAELQAKAQELGKNALAIYRWVHDNVDYLPTYGSAQGAQDTFDKKRGNAFDTASLLIAMLRSAGIHSRYVYGTVEIPAEKVMNWVGGMKTAEAAQQLLAQGGIPHTLLTSGGKPVAFRLEHVWVEAWLDYYPSRGAKHIGGVSKGNAWVPMDPSFKQFTYTAGMDLQRGFPINAIEILDSAATGATVNVQESWVQNVSQKNLEEKINELEQIIKTHIESRKANASIGDVLGAKFIKATDIRVFPNDLPHMLLVVAGEFHEMPAGLRHQFRYELFASAFDRSMGNAIWSYQAPTVVLIGADLGVTFRPKRQQDIDSIAALMPKPRHDGSQIRLEELPQSLPTSIRVTSELKLKGKIVIEGGDFYIGDELVGQGAFTAPDLAAWEATNGGSVIAGQTSIIGVSILGISGKALKDSKGRLEMMRVAIVAGEYKDIPGGEFSSQLLNAMAISYFRGIDATGELGGQINGVIDIPFLSYGLFSFKLIPKLLYGSIRTEARFSGVELDISHLRHIRWSKDDDRASWFSYNKLRGYQASELERVVPEIMLVDPRSCVELVDQTDAQKPVCVRGVSATKALSLASQEGQKIFRVTKGNYASVLPKLRHSVDVVSEIRDAVLDDKIVEIHEKQIAITGWVGAGYVVYDMDSGYGRYAIQGGANGGYAHWTGFALTFLMLLALYAPAIAFGAALITVIGSPLIAGAAAIAALIAAHYQIVNNVDPGPVQTILRGLIGVLVGAVVAAVAAAVAPAAVVLGIIIGIFVGAAWTVFDTLLGFGDYQGGVYAYSKDKYLVNSVFGIDARCRDYCC